MSRRMLCGVRSSRRTGAALTSTALSWLIACTQALPAESFAILRTRSASTGPSPVFGVAVASPDSTAWAAASASTASFSPRRRRADRSGRLTSTTVTASARSVRPAQPHMIRCLPHQLGAAPRKTAPRPPGRGSRPPWPETPGRRETPPARSEPLRHGSPCRCPPRERPRPARVGATVPRWSRLLVS